MKYTSAYPEIGTGKLGVEPIISPALFELERERLFKKVWLKVGRLEEVPNVGDYKVKKIDVAHTSIILIRGKDGGINAFHNICPHRGNKIISETGNETFGHARANVLSCRFHGWVFDTDGPVRSIPREEAFSSLDKKCLGLRSVHCDVWEGFIFINLDENPTQSLSEYLGGLGDHFSGYPYGDSTCSYRYSTVLNCNWKVALYAFTEGYHVSTIHAATFPSLATLQHTDFKLFGPHSTSTLYVPPAEGIVTTPATAAFGSVLQQSERHRPHLDQLPKGINPDRREDFQFEFPSVFPNFLLHLGAGAGYPGMTYFTHQFWPIAWNKTLWEGTNYFRPPTKPSERAAMAHVNALHRNAWLEDTGTMEDTHEALTSGVLKELVLMDEELMIRNTDYHWRRYIGV
ncbi:MAG: Rieske (2Fe-2S) protein [Alphaproteobacteria bacterium]|nr:MAG: Rieske (2Fe-2S) protein [Alphaproteobacteria bacterium]